MAKRIFMKQYNHIYTTLDDFEAFLAHHKIDKSSSTTLIQIFTSLSKKTAIEDIAANISNTLPHATLIGSSTAGEIIDGEMVEETTTLSFSIFEKTKIKAYDCKEQDSYILGLALSKKVFNKDVKCVISFVDGLLHNGQDYLDGLSSMNYNKAVISGGMAANNLSFSKTYTIHGKKVFSGGGVCAALESEVLDVHADYNLGWKAVGPTFTITKSKGARVYEIDNRPVKDVYAEVLGEFAVENMPASTIEFPLILQDANMLIARSMLYMNDDGSILYGGNLEEGAKVRFGIGSRTLVNRCSLSDEFHKIRDKMQCCFIYSCVARKQFLGTELEKSFAIIQNSVPTVGFFTYGEFFFTKESMKLLNVTSSLLFLREEGTAKQEELDKKVFKIDHHSQTDNALFHLIDYVTLELQEQEKRFRASKFKLDEFLKALDSVVIISRTDKEGLITYVNERFIEISGYTKKELLGEPHSMIRDPNVPSSLFKDLWQTIKLGHVWKGEFSNLTKDGKPYYVKCSVIPIHDENYNIIEYMAIREDVTSLVENRKKAEEAEVAQAMFLANMSHEIRTPMNGILGFSELLAKTQLDGTQEKYLKVIASSTKLLLNIVNDILDSSKLANEKIMLENLPLNPFEEFRTTFELLKLSANEKDLDYTMSIDSDVSQCLLSDSMRLRQVMSNLLSNAIKFTPQRGKVAFEIKVLKSEITKQKIRFSVKDTGIGIKESKLQTIFEPFSQADLSTTRKFGGTGLGLSISSDLLKAFKSELKVTSQEGVGSCFYFDLEFTTCSDDEVIEITPQPNVCKSSEDFDKFHLELLIVEDYEVNRMLVESLFEKYRNVQFTFAVNGAEALKILQNKSFDLILMDINMPVMNGVDATRYIREEMKLQTPIVALTANVLQGDREKFIAQGMNDYLSKPIEIDKLQEILCKYARKENRDSIGVNLPKILERIENKIGIGEAMALRLLGTFTQSLKEVLPKLLDALEEENLENIYEYAHKLKGAAATLYVEEIYEIFEFIENEALAKRVVDVSHKYAQVQEYVMDLDKELQAYH